VRDDDQPFLDPKIFIGQSNFLKLAFVRLLQAAYSGPDIPDEYRWQPRSPNPAQVSEQGARHLWIYRASPNRTTGLPAIFIEAEPGDFSITQLGNADREIVNRIYATDPVSLATYVAVEIYGGPIWVPIKLTIVAKTTQDREILTEYTAILVRSIFRPVFLKARIEFLDIQAGDAGEEGDSPATKRFLGTVDIKCQTQFKMPVSTELIQRVRTVNLDGLRFVDAGGDVEPIPTRTP